MYSIPLDGREGNIAGGILVPWTVIRNTVALGAQHVSPGKTIVKYFLKTIVKYFLKTFMVGLGSDFRNDPNPILKIIRDRTL